MFFSYQCVLLSRVHLIAPVFRGPVSVSLEASYRADAVYLVRTQQHFIPCHMKNGNKRNCNDLVSVKFSSLHLHSAQVFPGQLHITSVNFVEEMRNRSSPIFQETAASITAAVGCELTKEGEQLKKLLLSLSLKHTFLPFHSLERPSEMSQGIDGLRLSS